MYSDYSTFPRFGVDCASTVTVARVFMTPMCGWSIGAKKPWRQRGPRLVVSTRFWYYTIFDVERVPSGMAAVN